MSPAPGAIILTAAVPIRDMSVLHAPIYVCRCGNWFLVAVKISVVYGSRSFFFLNKAAKRQEEAVALGTHSSSPHFFLFFLTQFEAGHPVIAEHWRKCPNDPNWLIDNCSRRKCQMSRATESARDTRMGMRTGTRLSRQVAKSTSKSQPADESESKISS